MTTDGVASAVASRLRERIMSGELEDGATLPRLDDLVGEFSTSRPTMRDALRILETEGLATVRRGRFGGAIVHRPQVLTAAQSLGMVLRANGVGIDDLTAAIHELEPTCAALCARRADRHTAVVTALRRVHDEAAVHVAGGPEFNLVTSTFHEQLVAGCGNETIKVLLGSLQVLWTAHAASWADAHTIDQRHFPDAAYRARCLEDHALLITLIDRGEADAAASVAGAHLAWTASYVLES